MNDWTSVEDHGCPDVFGIYICYFSDRAIETFPYDVGDDMSWGVGNVIVTHWMPLPEPPK